MEELIRGYMEDDDPAKTMRVFQEDMTAEERLECVVVLEKMLWFGPSSSMKRFVRLLLEEGDIPTTIRCRMAEQVYEADDPVYVRRIREWIRLPDMEVACRIEWISKIQRYPPYVREDRIEDWMNEVFRHPVIAVDDFYRHRTVMDAYHQMEQLDEFIQLMKKYKTEFHDPVMYRVMLAQLLLDRDRTDPFEEDADRFLTECLDELLTDMTSGVHPIETQADIFDFFLNTDYTRIQPAYREQARVIMARLFQEDMTSSLSVFANRQNVHSESIEASSQEVLQRLHEKYGSHRHEPFQQVQGIRAEVEKWEAFTGLTGADQLKVEIALNRIVFDKRLYGKTGDSLSSILGLVWRHIEKSDHTAELQKRLLEELIEASGQCSTGIAVRLLNTLSGFDDFMIGISYRESIMAKVMHHLSRVIQEMDDSALQVKLLEEMIVPDSDYTERKNFLALFRKEIPVIKEALYEEFRDVLTDTDFDLYLKQAVIHYQGE
jgi:hypothetical protein